MVWTGAYMGVYIGYVLIPTLLISLFSAYISKPPTVTEVISTATKAVRVAKGELDDFREELNESIEEFNESLDEFFHEKLIDREEIDAYYEKKRLRRLALLKAKKNENSSE